MVDEKGDEYGLKDKYKARLITAQSKSEINKIIKSVKNGQISVMRRVKTLLMQVLQMVAV